MGQRAIDPGQYADDLIDGGPVGALAENVLQRTKQAELDARKALTLATDANATLGALLEDLQGAFTYHAGAISAQGG